jgi:hypothetical protein
MFVLMTLTVSGQKAKPKNASWYDDKVLHFGFSLGFNTMDFKITPNQEFLAANHLLPEVTMLNPGINIQIVTNFRPAKYFDLRFLPGVSFGQRIISYYDLSKPVDSPGHLYGEQKLESSFLEFPLLLKFKGDRLNNIRPYVIGGFNFRYDLAGKKEFDPEKPVYIRLERPDLYYEAGAGFDFYLTYFKLSIELKMSRGFGDVLVKEAVTNYEEYYNAIDRMSSQIWILAFHFE